tara:strand:- start:153 stop:437 length:285 start_codon:yes stop_codon:yes gene_type:complete
MSRKVRKVTSAYLKQMIVEEARKLRTEVLETGASDVEKVAASAEEVDADKLADSLVKDIDFVKALKIKEARLKRALSEVRRVKDKLRKRITKRL